MFMLIFMDWYSASYSLFVLAVAEFLCIAIIYGKFVSLVRYIKKGYKQYIVKHHYTLINGHITIHNSFITNDEVISYE